MNDLTTKAAYLKGLADGMKLDETKDANKIIISMIDLFSEMAEKFDMLDNEVGFLADSLDDIDGELDEIAEILSECCGDCDCGGFDDEDDCFEVNCPTCKQNIVLNMEEFDDEAACPICGETIEFDFDFSDDLDEEE